MIICLFLIVWVKIFNINHANDHVNKEVTRTIYNAYLLYIALYFYSLYKRLSKKI